MAACMLPICGLHMPLGFLPQLLCRHAEWKAKAFKGGGLAGFSEALLLPPPLAWRRYLEMMREVEQQIVGQGFTDIAMVRPGAVPCLLVCMWLFVAT